MSFLSEQELKSVADAIHAAEARTSGEIVTVVAAHSDSYLWPTLLVATCIAFVGPGVLAHVFGLVSAGDLFFVQIVALLVLEIPLCVPRIRFALIPPPIKRAGARRRAREQFLERGLHHTQHRTGVLIFVSVAERYVEILADEGIHAKVGAAAWQTIVDRFVDDVRNNKIAYGFRSAVKSVGDLLERHFPAAAKNPNELPDRLYVI